MSIYEAADCVRRDLPGYRIEEGYKFRGKYVFHLSDPSDVPSPAGTIVEVLENGTVVTADWDELFSYLEELENAQKNSVVFGQI